MRPTGVVAVVGSINLDIVCEVEVLPRPGETVLARGSRRNVGGKGSNQAVAAALAGAEVRFIGRLGDDAAATTLRTALTDRGIDVTALRTVADATSGVAYILVAEDNIITVDSGANMRWEGAAAVAQEGAAVAAAAVVVSQCEVPLEVIEFAARHATGRFVLNAAPSRALPAQVLAKADPLVVNEHELADLSARPVRTVDEARAAAQGLPARSVVVTLGASGALWVAGAESGTVPAPPTTVVDTTGAGDAFVGNLAAGLAQGASLARATERAVVAASLSVQTPGTHDSYPTDAAVRAALQKG